MGRWSQRRHGSSAGSGAGPALISILEADYDDFVQVTLVYSGQINVADFDPLMFISMPSGLPGGSLSQVDATTLLLNLDAGSIGDTSVDFAGSVNNVQSPQTIDYT